jgi:hypothetical protein
LIKILKAAINEEYKNDEDLKFDDPSVYTFEKKLKVLTQHQDELVV